MGHSVITSILMLKLVWIYYVTLHVSYAVLLCNRDSVVRIAYPTSHNLIILPERLHICLSLSVSTAFCFEVDNILKMIQIKIFYLFVEIVTVIRQMFSISLQYIPTALTTSLYFINMH